MLFLPLIDKKPDIIIGSIPQLLEYIQLSLCSCICFYLKTLCTFNKILGGTNFKALLYDKTVKAPGEVFIFQTHLFSNSLLQCLYLRLNMIVFNLLINFEYIALGREKNLLLTSVYIKFKEILTHQVIDLRFISTNFILDSNSFSVAMLIELTPDFLYFSYPYLVRCMSCICHRRLIF